MHQSMRSASVQASALSNHGLGSVELAQRAQALIFPIYLYIKGVAQKYHVLNVTFFCMCAAQFGSCTGGGSDCHTSGYGHVPVIMSSKLTSHAHIRYGKVEVVAQLPKGDWIWPGK